MTKTRARLYRQLAPEGWERFGLSPTNKLVCLLILLAAFTAVIETEAGIRDAAPFVFDTLEAGFAILFTVEYLARIYAAGEDPRYGGIAGRLRYMLSWWALVDLLAILPFFLGFIAINNAFLLRLLRIVRLLRLSRLGRFSQAWSALAEAVKARMHELLLSLGLAGLLLLFSSACLYVVEAAHQPEAFGSVPRALWWSIATLTTVGYGDVTPITAWGKLFAGVTAIAGIGLIAMPTGILAAACSNAFQKKNAREEQ
ncbi:potassium channel protein [Zobellella denitrificans]|uniref:Potassium channel protein n=2 Tax=Zobellella denitrificans TaxID=347534 RepID=A0A291HPK8_9GAMM|nr:potassium channel protein [Zobellella denitrificans]